jgi:hypothetical protein
MATKLTKITRETDVRDPCFGKTLMVQLEGGVIRMWQKGTRRKFAVPLVEIWRLGTRAAATRVAQ